jgi:superfamily II DNA or RNA helicase
MSYFSEHYPAFRYPVSDGDVPGFRIAQLGAIHAAGAHFVTRADPGIITMPTGSGKTAVLIAAAFVLRAKRVLIIAPSRLVREQIAEEVESLKTLREAGALNNDVPAPKVFATNKRISDAAEWEAMREFDVVVGTVQSISPEYDEIPEPPADLFDLVLVDEAHHSPARTWQRVLDHFDGAKRLLFTATPFRQDQREIKGRFIFTYDLRQAFVDGIFGAISYVPVAPAENESSDVAIARAAERQFVHDRDEGFQHRLMVRTDSRKRAAELAKIYSDNTGLRLSIVTGDKSLRYVKGIVQKLTNSDLDGIICVNMLGEGFNFPSLKIAAVHSPHRSLSVTLQFIGRFARTAGANLGPATFLAVPSEIQIEAERLYDTRAVWQDMVQNLSATRVQQEAQVREVLESFQPTDLVSEDLDDLSLYVLEPYFHVKVYQLSKAVDIEGNVVFPDALQVVYKSISEANNASIYITREISLPRWTTDDRLSIVEHDLFIFYQDPDTNLLFVCASRRGEGLYEQLAESFREADPRPLPLVRLNRALNDLGTPEFFNVGMRNRVASNTTESYRMITGSNADKAILKSDGRLYHRGHVFGRAVEEGEQVTIGLSSASKIWSNRSAQLPELIDWCSTLAARIHSGRDPVTGSGLDFLAVGEEIGELPPGIIDVAWPASVYRTAPTATFTNAGGHPQKTPLLDFDLAIDADASTDEAVMVELRHSTGFAYRLTFSFETDRFFEPAIQGAPPLTVEVDRGDVAIVDFLNDAPLQFYTSDLSLIDGYSLLRPSVGDPPVFDDRVVETIDWPAASVDITREFGPAPNGQISVHTHLENLLRAATAEVVYYDHGTGEIADFIEFERAGQKLIIRLYHCKGATRAAPGHRLGDIYEISGQAVKSVAWALKQRILGSIRRRFTSNIGSHRFIRGDLNALVQLLEAATPAQIEFEFVAVQPGLKKEGLPAELANLLAAASDHLVRGSFRPLRVLGSA